MSDSRQVETGVVVLAHATLRRALVVATAIVVGLGIFREIFVATVGTHTVLKDLRHIALNSEHCLGSWYSSLLLLSSAALFAVTAHLARRDGQGNVWHWRLLALVFVGLAGDEMLEFHEQVTVLLRDALDLSGVFFFAWVIPALFMVSGFALAFVPFLLRIRRQTAIGMIAAGAIFVGGALGVEMIGGWIHSTVGPDTVAYITAFLTEEILEMIGIVVLILVLTRHIAASWPNAAFAIR